jgi:hypothetical protein
MLPLVLNYIGENERTLGKIPYGLNRLVIKLLKILIVCRFICNLVGNGVQKNFVEHIWAL